MEFINRLADTRDPDQIIFQLTDGISGDYDLALLFITPNASYDAKKIYQDIARRIKIRNFLSCTCAGVIATQREIEGEASASLLLVRLPGVGIKPFYLDQQQISQWESKEDLYKFFEIYPNEKPVFFILPDPFLMDINQCLGAINSAYPQCSVVGGLASAASRERENILIENHNIYDEGMVGFVLTGCVKTQTLVSQGCRPIGKTHIITRAEGNVILELAGRSFYDVVNEELLAASPSDRALAEEAVFVGIAMNEYTHQFRRGDFLIRQVVGIDAQSGAGAVADYVQAGQTVQLHLRDARTAREDLTELLMTHKNQHNLERLKGVIVFSCNGRGEGLFRVKDHDIQLIQKWIGPVPAAGFFCAGEIGPVGGVNFVHGFTSSMVMFYEQ